MRRAKRRLAHGRAIESARKRMDGRDLDGLVDGKRRQERAGGAGQHGLAGAWWSVQSYIVASSSCDLESALGALLAADISERDAF
jgi:hypothetical protein